MRKMTEKGFLHLSNKKVSPQDFINAHRDFLSNEHLKHKTLSILHKLDDGAILPSIALNELRHVVMNCLLDSNIEKGKQRLSQKTKPYIATIYDNSKIVILESKKLIKDFNCSIHAQNWCDCRLFNGGQNWYAEISYKADRVIRIDRLDSIARMLKQKTKAVTRQVAPVSAPWKMRAKGDRFYFSKG